MKRTFSVVALSALTMLSTSCAHDTLKQLKKDVVAGAKLGAGTAVIFTGGGMVAKAASNKLTPIAPGVASAITTAQIPVSAIVLVTKNGEAAEKIKDSSLQSQAVQVLSTIATYVGTDLAIKQIVAFAASYIPGTTNEKN